MRLRGGNVELMSEVSNLTVQVDDRRGKSREALAIFEQRRDYIMMRQGVC
jgi:hypothetical protein